MIFDVYIYNLDTSKKHMHIKKLGNITLKWEVIYFFWGLYFFYLGIISIANKEVLTKYPSPLTEWQTAYCIFLFIFEWYSDYKNALVAVVLT